jgi:anti-sigma factor RsiW
MNSKEHLSEAILNMYLDGELSAGERERVEAHLAACEVCQAEVTALQRLFATLEELELAPALAPDLAPGVLAHIHPRRRLLELRRPSPHPLWLVPALQSVAALALLAWGWTRLAGYLALAVDFLSLGTLADAWAEVSGWMTAQWATLSAWPSATWAEVQEWAARVSAFSDLHLSLTQLVALGAALVVLWLVGNVVLLHRDLFNGRVMHKETLK